MGLCIEAGAISDEASAEACEYLAYYCSNEGRLEDAAFYCSRLLEYHGSEGDRARGLLKELQKKLKGNSAGYSAAGGRAIGVKGPKR